MFLHALHEFWTQDALVIARPIIDIGGGGELAALLHAGEDDGM